MQAGSFQAVVYELFHLVDELLHTLEVLVPEQWLEYKSWRTRFCDWCHRKDMEP